MEIRKLRRYDTGESGGVTLPKDDLREEGLVQDGSVVDAHVAIEKVDDGEWRLTLVDEA